MSETVINFEEMRKRLFEAKDSDARLALVFEYIERCEKDPANLEKFYDVWATLYDDDCWEKENKLIACLSEFIEDYLGGVKEGRVLDIGAGTGRAGVELAKLGFKHVDGLDASKGMLELAKRRGVYENLFHETIDANNIITAVKGGHMVFTAAVQEELMCLDAYTRKLADEGLLQVVQKKYVKNIFDDQHGYIWSIKRR